VQKALCILFLIMVLPADTKPVFGSGNDTVSRFEVELQGGAVWQSRNDVQIPACSYWASGRARLLFVSDEDVFAVEIQMDNALSMGSSGQRRCQGGECPQAGFRRRAGYECRQRCSSARRPPGKQGPIETSVVSLDLRGRLLEFFHTPSTFEDATAETGIEDGNDTLGRNFNATAWPSFRSSAR